MKTLLSFVFLVLACVAQTPPFANYQGVNTSGRLGWITRPQLGNTSTALLGVTWCEQDQFAFTPAGTTVDMGVPYGLSPTIGHQIVLVSEGYRCQPFPPFQSYFPVGSYVPMMGVSVAHYGPVGILPLANPNWSWIGLDPATVTYFVPPFVYVMSATMLYERFLATIDVPNDPLLVGTVLYHQSFRLDPFTGENFAGRAAALWLQ